MSKTKKENLEITGNKPPITLAEISSLVVAITVYLGRKDKDAINFIGNVSEAIFAEINEMVNNTTEEDVNKDATETD